MILHGDALTTLKTLDSESVNTCVTSPPYWNLRDYGTEGQLGLEDDYKDYINKIVKIFREVKRVLKKDGTLWLNLGDSYSVSARGGLKNKPGDKSFTNKGCNIGHKKVNTGLRPKNMMGIPWRVAFALQEDDWILRQDIIWAKSNPMPESVRDRCTKSHEYIFLFSKNERYYFDNDAIKEPAICGAKGSRFDVGKTGKHQLGRSQNRAPSGWATGQGSHNTLEHQSESQHHKTRPSKKRGEFNGKTGDLSFRAVVEMRNKRSVWTVPTKAFKGAHFATFPPKLIEPCILAGCPIGGLVLDPFLGSGTVGMVCKLLKRDYVGIEINYDYIKIAEERIANASEVSLKSKRRRETSDRVVDDLQLLLEL